MASNAKRKPGAGEAVTAWQRFAAVSRAVQATGKPRPKSLPGRSGATSTARKGTQSVAQATAQATAQAQRLGRTQAQWVIEQRKEARVRRARAVAAAASSLRSGTRKSAATKATAKPALAAAASGSRGVLVAEGDSWFDYPFYDVLQILDDDHGWDIEQVAHRGDSVESMAYDGGQLDDFVRAIERVARRGEVPHAILISGGGNDIAGDTFAMLLNHRSSPVYGLNPAVVEGVLETRVRVAYTTVVSAVTAACDALLGIRVPILLHGYDYPVPDGRGVLGGWGPLPGPWLEPGFRKKGYDDLAECVAIARDLIDRFYEMLRAVIATPAFAHVRLVDLRNTLSTDLASDRYRTWWGNELHPTRQGFAKVAGQFDALL